MEKGGEQLPLSVSTILGGTIKKIKKEVNSSFSFKVHVPPIHNQDRLGGLFFIYKTNVAIVGWCHM